MHQDPFVSTGGLSFHPPTPSNIIASKSRDGIYRSPLSLSLSTKVLLEFLFAKISSSSRKAKQNNCNLVG